MREEDCGCVEISKGYYAALADRRVGLLMRAMLRMMELRGLTNFGKREEEEESGGGI